MFAVIQVTLYNVSSCNRCHCCVWICV